MAPSFFNCAKDFSKTIFQLVIGQIFLASCIDYQLTNFWPNPSTCCMEGNLEKRQYYVLAGYYFIILIGMRPPS